jgi:hypothetical protein
MNILMVHAYPTARLRASQLDLLWCLRRFGNERCYYYNAALWDPPSFLCEKVHFDLVIFSYSFTDWRRLNDGMWRNLLDRGRRFIRNSRLRVLMPQDECAFTDPLNDSIEALDITNVLSVASPSEWGKIYERVDRSKVSIGRVLTGYIDPNVVQHVEAVSRRSQVERDIDLGYRSYFTPEWGTFGLYKLKLADRFARAGRQASLRMDISCEAKDFFHGDDWYRFLLRCRYTAGAESGGSLLDRTGGIAKAIRLYRKQHPAATFEEIEAACFPGGDDTIRLRALSPRHFEACMTRTCQALVVGEYNGILQPDVHYIPIKPDLSNVEGVIEAMRDDGAMTRMVERAYDEIVRSERFGYDRLAAEILALAHNLPLTSASSGSRFDYWRAEILDRMGWSILRAGDQFGALKRLGRWLYGSG